MKKKLLEKSISNIQKHKSNITNEELEVIAYGLESIYLLFTKLIIIILLAIILNILKKTILILLFYNIIRLFAFGMHSKKSIHCLIISLLFFIIIPYLTIYLHISNSIKIILAFICLIFIFIYAPADTVKRPLINKKKRIKFKVLSIITGITLIFFIIYFKDFQISNYMLIGFIEATIMILPITYKIFNLPYNNYKTYKEV